MESDINDQLGAARGASLDPVPPTEVTRSEGSSGRWWRLFRIGIGAGILGFLLTQTDLEAAWRVVANARLELLLLAFASVVGSRIVASVRWYLLVRARHATTLFGVIRLTFISNFAGYFMPGGLGVEVLRVYGLAKTTADPAFSAASVLVERVVALGVLVLLVLVGMASRPLGLPAEIDRLAWLCLALLVFGVLAIMVRLTRRLALGMLPGKRLAPIRGGLQKVFAALDAYRSRPALIAGSFLLALIFQLMRCASVTASAAALGHPVPLTFIMVVYPIMLLISLLPISIAGLGVREAGFVYFLGLAGMPVEIALPLALIQRLFTILVILPGGWWYLRHGLRG